MADKIRIGIVGATVTQGGSGWGANAHVPALRLLPAYELKAVCTAHADTAQASKEKFGAEFDELAARVTTRIQAWKSIETGQDVPVDAPDSISVAGVLESGAEVSVQVAAMPFSPSGTRLEIYGREGSMVISAARAFGIGPNVLSVAKGNAPLAEMQTPGKYTLVRWVALPEIIAIGNLAFDRRGNDCVKCA